MGQPADRPADGASPAGEVAAHSPQVANAGINSVYRSSTMRPEYVTHSTHPAPRPLPARRIFHTQHTMPGPLDALWQWFVGAGGTVVAAIGGVVYRNRERSLTNKHRLEGDPENPSDEGLLDMTYETRERVKQLESRMEREHREVMSKLDDLDDGRFESEAD